SETGTAAPAARGGVPAVGRESRRPLSPGDNARMSVVVADTGAGKALADLRLVDDEGSLHRLGDAWAGRPTVLAFLRHYGCIFCRLRVAQLMKRSGEIRAAGAGLALLGRGTPPMAHAFREESGFRGAMYVDPEGKSYEAAGMVRGAITRFI